MENASKALIIAGAVLIGILIISMGVLLATTLQKTARTHYTSMSTNEIQKFNSEITKNFIIENGETYITAQGIITLKNILNTETYKELVKVKPDLNATIQDDANFLKNKALDTNSKLIKYKVNKIEYNQGMISSINIDINI